MKTTQVEHIGIAVRNLEAAIPRFERLLGTLCYGVEEVVEQQVRTAFFRVGDTKIELLESTAPEGPIGKFIEKKGEGLHHIAFAVEGLHAALAELEQGGTQLIDKVPRRGAEGLDIAFLHPKSVFGVLVELCEHSNEPLR
jgi:methylmalonyl-CoA/ethylmalonyl-CoA epimerase